MRFAGQRRTQDIARGRVIAKTCTDQAVRSEALVHLPDTKPVHGIHNNPGGLAILPNNAILVYDGDCPFCSLYVKYLRVQQALGSLELVNARFNGEWVDAVRQRGMDLNQGMVLIVGGNYYYGSECMHRLALMSTRSGWFNRCNAWLFSRPRLADRIYPWLKRGRQLTLRLLGRQQIE